jgi:hypothetical protein
MLASYNKGKGGSAVTKPHNQTVLLQPIHTHISCIREPPPLRYKLCNPITNVHLTMNPRLRAQ